MNPARQTSATPAVLQFGDERAIVVFTRRVRPVAEHQRLDARGGRVIEARRAGAVRDHDGDRRIEPPALNRVDDCLEIRAASRDQDAETTGHHGRRSGAGSAW
jgi:hypothetical protein